MSYSLHGFKTPEEEVESSTKYKLADDAEWKVIQKNTFTRWVNERLKLVNKRVENIEEDLSDGLNLISLLEVLSGKKFQKYTRKPLVRPQKLENITMALTFLQVSEKIKIVNIDSSDIVDHNTKLILGLIWMLILHYAIATPNFDLDDFEERSSPSTPQKVDLSPKQRLLHWIRNKVPDIEIKNFASDWNDGRAIGALVDGVAPGLCPDWEIWKPTDAFKNSKEAMTLAEDWLDIPQLIKPEEMCNPQVDEMSVMTYLSQFPNAQLKPGAPLRPRIYRSKVRVFGPGIKQKDMMVGKDAEFSVETVHAGEGELRIELVEPNKNIKQVETIFNNDKFATYTCNYTPEQEGLHQIKIFYSGHEIPKSPFQVEVSGIMEKPPRTSGEDVGLQKSGNLFNDETLFVTIQPKNTDFSVCTVSGRGIQKTGLRVGDRAKFKVTLPGQAEGNELKVEVIDINGVNIKSSIKQLTDSEYECEYQPQAPGVYGLSVTYTNKHVGKSPYAVEVKGPSKCPVMAFGPGLRGGLVGWPSSFCLETNGDTGALAFSIEGPSKAEIDCEDNEDGSATIAYHPTQPGEYAVHILCNEEDIKGSPFIATITDPPLEVFDPSKVQVSGSIVSGDAQMVGVPFHFEVRTQGSGDGDLETSVRDAEGNPVEVVLLTNKNNVFNYEAIPEHQGRHTLLVSHRGILTPGSPFKFLVNDPSDPSKVILYGPALESKVVVSETTYLLVDCSKAGPGDVAIMMSDVLGKDVPMETEEFGMSSFKVIFTPLRAGRIEGKVYFADQEISSSPFYVNVKPNFDLSKIYLEGFQKQSFLESPMEFVINAKEVEMVSNMMASVETPSGRSEVIPLHDNKDGTYRGILLMHSEGPHKVSILCDGIPLRADPEVVYGRAGCDPSLVKVHGSGIKSGFTNNLQSFVVQTEGAGQGRLNVSVSGPSEAKVTCRDNRDGTCRVEYLPITRGTYEVSVLFGENHVPGSPFVVEIKDDVQPSKIRFDDLQEIVAKKGHESKFKIDTRLAGRSYLKVVAIGPKGDSKQLPVTLDDDDGIWSIKFLPQSEGLYTIEVWFGGEKVRTSKVQVHPSFDASKVVLRGAGIGENVPASLETNFQVETSEAGEAELIVKIEDHLGNHMKHEITKVGRSQYMVQYTPEEVGHCLLRIFYGGDEVFGSPKRVAAVPSGESSKVKISGDTDSKVLVGRDIQILLSHSDAGNAKAKCSIENDKLEKIPVQVTEVGQGKSEIVYRLTEPGTYNVRILFGGREIPGGNFQQKALSRRDFDQWENEVIKSKSSVVLANGISGSDVDERSFRDFYFNVPMGPVFGFIKAEVVTPSGITEVPQVINNADGTITIKYLPSQNGHHLLKVTCNEDPVDDFSPLHFQVESSSPAEKVKATGSGLSTGVCNSMNSFNISLTGSDASGIAISIEGPSKVGIDLEEGGDESVNVYYKAELPGDYLISIFHSHQHIPGSPFTAKILPLFKDTTLAQMSIGSKHSEPLNLGLEAYASDLSCLTCRVTTPMGTNQKAVPRILEGHKLGVLFDAKELGTYSFEVLKNGTPVRGSPVQKFISPNRCFNADSVKVFGAGLLQPRTGLPNEFSIDYRNAGIGELSLSMDGPNKVNLECVEDKDGVCKIQFTPHEPGMYVLTILFSSEHVLGSPFLLDVVGDGIRAEPIHVESLVQSYSALSYIGKESLLNLMIPASIKDTLRVFVRGPTGVLDSCHFVPSPNSDKNYSVGFVPKETGIHLVHVSDGKNSFPGSPFTFIVGPLFPNSGDQNKIKVSGPGLNGGYVNVPGVITIDSKSAGEGNLSITMEGVLKPDINFRDKHNGTCDITYTCGKPGDYLLSIRFNGKHIKGSPFAILIKGFEAVDSESETKKIFNPNEPALLELKGTQAKGKIEATINSPSGAIILPIVQEHNAEGHIIRFIPRERGLHLVNVTCDGRTLVDSPYKILIGKLTPDPSKVVCSGSGLSFGRTGEYSEFTISTEGSGFGPLEVSVDGPSQVNLVCQNTSERPLKFFYKPSSPGVYRINVCFAGKIVPSSPFDAEVLGPGKPLPWNEVSNFSLDISPGEELIELSQYLKTKGTPKQNNLLGDSNLITCSGEGLKNAFVHQPSIFCVDASATNSHQMLNVEVLGPTGQCSDINISSLAPKRYLVTYRPEVDGLITLSVQWGKNHVQGSPFHVSVAKSVPF